MSSSLTDLGKKLRGYCLTAAIVALPCVPATGSETVLYSFQGGGDGAQPDGGVIEDDAGNLYGTTESGGSENCNGFGCGTVFKLAPGHSETVLHAFTGGCDGAGPVAGLVTDEAGNLYGTTQGGGACSGAGYGTVFKLAPDGTETVLYAFKGGQDGFLPLSTLVIDKKGNLYGTTDIGGNITACGNPNGCGIVFEVAPNGKKKTLHAFQDGNDGALPMAGMIMDKSGNLYGTTQGGGSAADGTVFKVTPDGTETVLYAFQGGNDGNLPFGGLVVDRAGNLYGTTHLGGSNSNDGAVFELASDGMETILHSFVGGTDGRYPEAGMVFDKSGNLYGTTWGGGSARCDTGGCGTVFKLAPDGTETVLYTFNNHRSGRHPAAPLLLGKHGALYGTTPFGSSGKNGVVFEVKTK